MFFFICLWSSFYKREAVDFCGNNFSRISSQDRKNRIHNILISSKTNWMICPLSYPKIPGKNPQCLYNNTQYYQFTKPLPYQFYCFTTLGFMGSMVDQIDKKYSVGSLKSHMDHKQTFWEKRKFGWIKLSKG